MRPKLLLTIGAVTCALSCACSVELEPVDWNEARLHSKLVMDSLHTATASRFFDSSFFPADQTARLHAAINKVCDGNSRRGGFVEAVEGGDQNNPGIIDFVYAYRYN